jgi:starch phosphorylase
MAGKNLMDVGRNLAIPSPAPRQRDPEALRAAILERLFYGVGRDPAHAVTKDWYLALASVVRDHIVDRWIPTARRTKEERRKRVYYLSMEFLIGRLLTDALANLDLTHAARQALADLGQNLDEVIAEEPDAALGNGGLGRLAACFLDSMSSLEIPAYGYGIRYEHGLFRQTLQDGWQLEEPEDWLIGGHPWEFERSEVRYRIGFGGRVDPGEGDRRIWSPAEEVTAVAYDTPIVGWGGRHVNALRLWKAEPVRLIDLERFNRGRHIEATTEAARAESLSRVLYPGDESAEGKELRLKQEYFFTAASIADLVHRFESEGHSFADLPSHAAIQLNDTHPAIAVPELVRLLVDVHGVDFRTALAITRATISYTNHTLLPEALERWPIDVFARILPRHLELVMQIDANVADELEEKSSADRFDAVRIVQPAEGVVRMGQLAFLGSHRTNGVSALHTQLLKKTIFRDLHALYPERIVNETNGVTPRRWIFQCNPGLRDVLTEAIGTAWIGDLEGISAIESFADDASFREMFHRAKRGNKVRLADWVSDELGLVLDPDALFDIQIKRIHEYKRQLLNLLHSIAEYIAIRREPGRDWTPRVKFLAGKAAPSYVMAKLVIKLANDVARMVNNDPVVGDRLRLIFVPNYNVSLAEMMIPATDLSEQISTAGMEASGTGNMKFALNGALTIGTLDGANVEMSERLGIDNIFIFGLRADDVEARWANGWCGDRAIDTDASLAEVIALLDSGLLSPEDPARYRPIVDALRGSDRFMVAADFASYREMQGRIAGSFLDRETWTTRSILNVARSGWFSSDRTVRGYAHDVWNLGDVGPS